MDAFLLSYIGFPLDFFKNEKKMGLDLIQKYFSGFTTQQIDQLSKMEGLYKDWNSKINVISRKDIDNLYPNHILHSLSISAFMSFSPEIGRASCRERVELDEGAVLVKKEQAPAAVK